MGAATALEWALARAPHHGPSELDLGVAYARQGRMTEAEPMWRAAAADDPTLADAWFDLGVAQMQSNRTDDARASFTAAVRVDPNMVKALKNLAGLESLAGNVAAAITWTDRALELQPDDADLHALRAELEARPR
jgi:Flp pilus assembly protein TadD